MILKYFLGMTTVLGSICVMAATNSQREPASCTSAREFITTLEYLRHRGKEWALDESVGRELAHQVSGGCTGAARRFIRVVDFLTRTELGTRDAIRIGKELALRSDVHAEAFIGIFKTAYAGDQLDLSIEKSLEVATRLSVEFEGPVHRSLSDYRRIASFCVESDLVGLSRPQCAVLAAEIVKSSEAHPKPVATAFIRTVEFLRSELGVNVSEALPLAREILISGPDAVDNFILAYRFGQRERGLSLTARGAVDFAMAIAKRTRPHQLEVVNRLPAGQ